MAGVVLLFTALAVAMVWGLSLRLQAQLREQMLDQAENRAQQLADALAGQTQSVSRLIGYILVSLSRQWVNHPQGFEPAVREALLALPAGIATGVTVVDAQGRLVQAVPGPLMVDQPGIEVPFLRRLREDPTRTVVAEPVVSPRDGQWVVELAHSVVRDGRFEGAILMQVSSDFLAASLAQLALASGDVVELVHPQGRVIARSQGNRAAVGRALPPGLPFMSDPGQVQGTYLQTDPMDGQLRILGWRRLSLNDAVLLVGLSERSVLAPLAHSQRQAMWLTVGLSLGLIAVGVWIGWLLRRLDRGQAQLEEAQHLARLGYWHFDAHDGAMGWSDEVYPIFGVTLNTFRPGFDAYWALVGPQDRKRLYKRFQQLMADGAGLDDVHRIVRPDGEERFVRLICRADQGRNGTRFHGTVQDVTELRQAQLALQKLNSSLERRVRVRTEELQALNRELEAFTYSVSHDLRTPLRSIHGFVNLLQETERDRLSGDGRDFLQRIQDSARRMGTLIHDLLAMAQHSRADITHRQVDVSALAHTVVQDLERSDPQRQVQWQIEPGLTVQADPTLMLVVLQNLLGNAWKYSGRTEQARIVLAAAGVEDGQQVFCVSDNGAGFDMAYADQLFEPFKRLHTYQQFEGTGIGLATVARVLQRHGGRIRGEGAPGAGARFWFSLPVKPMRYFSDSAPSEH